MTGRAGVYVAQPTGYRAFLPAPLPPSPEVRLGGELSGLLSRADLALGRLDGSIQTLPNPDLFVYMYVRKEAVLSSQIEGTQASLTDLLEHEAREPREQGGDAILGLRELRPAAQQPRQIALALFLAAIAQDQRGRPRSCRRCA